MSYSNNPNLFRGLLLGLIVGHHLTWRQMVNRIVPDPYMDEVFHISQAQAYWDGKWSQWDPKLTTPPGMYLFSHAVNSIRKLFSSKFEQNVEELRFVNYCLPYLLIVSLYIWTSVSKRTIDEHSILQREVSIVFFPLIYFFSTLYYTDVFSVLTVVWTYIFWFAGVQSDGGKRVIYQFLHLAFGLLSLSTRQTNIFWVAVFLGGLQVVETTKQTLVPRKIHDSAISDAYFEDFPITSISIAQHAIGIIPRILLDLWPQVALLASFGAFVVWNGGVVLGDKDNHIATIHFPQMLYFWPFMVFFSWPVLIPLFSNLATFRLRIPRLAYVVAFLIIFTAAVKFNTIVHPFTLADNRHYVFYVFRILMRHWAIKYAVIPVYIACAWLVIATLGRSRGTIHDTVHVSFILVWLISTTLSLITAPLVEPRYYIIPWLIWRLHVPEVVSHEPRISQDSKNGVPQTGSKSRLQTLSEYSTWIELTWYMVINMATGYMFLFKGFTWPQEPGAIQRFMW